MTKRLKALLGSLVLIIMSLTATTAQADTGRYWQCAPFARLFSGVQLFGNAYTWWQQATGRYAQGKTPQAGAVLVFKAFGKMRVGHVAVVSQIVSDRIIKVTHANWSVINGRRGQIERDVTVVDASPNNDWSRVRVWYDSIKDVGTKAYPVYGFIYGGKAGNADEVNDTEATEFADAGTSDEQSL